MKPLKSLCPLSFALLLSPQQVSPAHEPMGSVVIRGVGTQPWPSETITDTDNRIYAAPRTDRKLKVSLAAAYDRKRDVAVSQKGSSSSCGKTFLTDS